MASKAFPRSLSTDLTTLDHFGRCVPSPVVGSYDGPYGERSGMCMVSGAAQDHDNIVALAMQVAQHAIDRSSPLDAWKWPSDENLPAIGVKKQSD